jgi:hypothetical protein
LTEIIIETARSHCVAVVVDSRERIGNGIQGRRASPPTRLSFYFHRDFCAGMKRFARGFYPQYNVELVGSWLTSIAKSAGF